MTFEEAVKQAVQHAKTQGEQTEQYILSIQFFNAINDFGGYEDMPAYETILKYALSKGLVKKLIDADDNDMKTNQLVAQASRNGGFRDDLVTDVFNTLLNAVFGNRNRKVGSQPKDTPQPQPKKVPQPNTINGHKYVDLGLSVKWATCNIGASSPSDYGDYFARGEDETKAEYTEDNSTTYGRVNYTFRDAAKKKWGGTWRMPTEAEFEELEDKCTWKWTTQGGHNGYKVTSKKNGNSIFLPAAGTRYGSSLYDAGPYGNYWSSTHYAGSGGSAYGLDFDSSDHDVISSGRYNGGVSASGLRIKASKAVCNA